jgi:hypothetical protein
MATDTDVYAKAVAAAEAVSAAVVSRPLRVTTFSTLEYLTPVDWTESTMQSARLCG